MHVVRAHLIYCFVYRYYRVNCMYVLVSFLIKKSIFFYDDNHVFEFCGHEMRVKTKMNERNLF